VKQDQADFLSVGQETTTALPPVSTGRSGVRWLRGRVRTRWILLPMRYPRRLAARLTVASRSSPLSRIRTGGGEQAHGAVAPRRGDWPKDCLDPGAMGNRIVRRDGASRFRSALIAERTRLAGGRQIDSEVLVLPGSVAVDDQAPLIHDQFVALRQHRMERRKLKLIDAALERLHRAEFGICAQCGKAIPFKRLEAIPWAACCVPCQERLGDGEFEEKDELCESTA